MSLKIHASLIFVLFLLIPLACLTNPAVRETGSDMEKEQGILPEKAPHGSGGWDDCSDRIAPLTHIKTQLNKLAPSKLDPDLSGLSPGDRETLEHLVRASFCMDQAFVRQVNEWNYCIQEAFNRSVAPGMAWYEEYFNIMCGPWDRLDEDKPFLDADAKPLGANFYPLNLTKDEWEKHLEAHPEDRSDFLDSFTMIRRDQGRLKAIPYAVFFKDQLGPCADQLNAAAETAEDPGLKRFLKSRAESFKTNDFFPSDMDWMDIGGDIEVVIGPYEVYEDGLFGYKAAFESQICVVDHEESAKLVRIEKTLNALEANLPLPEEHKNFNRGADCPIKVVHQVYAGGDAKAGILTAAFNLPNDERVRELKGSKKVMLKNVMMAKFESCAVPIAEKVLAVKDLGRISFDAFFNIILMHEVSHGLGPGKITKNGKETTVNLELKECYSPIEECKADVLSLYNIPYLMEQGILSASIKENLYPSYLGDIFRALRFGIDQAHGASQVIQLNYLLDHGAVGIDGNGHFSVEDGLIAGVIADLAGELLLIQAEGDYAAAKAFLEKYRVVKPEVRSTLARLEGIPVDIRPIYPLAERLREEALNESPTPAEG
ncbi:MAG: peptidase [Planctomycetes bacterium]|nr:peptidase [Planctomycetota bacterium]